MARTQGIRRSAVRAGETVPSDGAAPSDGTVPSDSGGWLLLLKRHIAGTTAHHESDAGRSRRGDGIARRPSWSPVDQLPPGLSVTVIGLKPEPVVSAPIAFNLSSACWV